MIVHLKEVAKINLSNYIIPIIIGIIIICGLHKNVDVFNEFLEGAKENIKVGVEILPPIIALMTCVSMFNASGALDIISNLIGSFTTMLGFPSECIPLAILRPISGSGALAVYETILSENGPDGFVGRVASVLLGSTETTFYTIAVYFGVTKIKKTRQTLIASLSADFSGFVFSALLVRIIFN